MLIVISVLLLALSALAFVWALSVFRRADRPDWTRREDSGAFVSLGIMLLGALGLGVLLKFVVEFRIQSFSVVDAVLACAIAVGTVPLYRWLLADYRRRRVAAPGPQGSPPQAA